MMLDARRITVVIMLFVLVQLPLLGVNTVVGKVVPRIGSSQLNGTPVELETTVFSGDSLTTGSQSLAVVQLPYGNQVHVGPVSSLSVSEQGQRVLVSLERGMTIIRSGNGRQVAVRALGLLVEPTGPAAYTVAMHDDTLYVSSDEGSVGVRGTNDSFVVPTGKGMKFQAIANTAPGTVGAGASNISPGVAAITAIAISLGASIPISIALANDAEDDAVAEARAAAREACIEAIQSVSATADTSGCDSI